MSALWDVETGIFDYLCRATDSQEGFNAFRLGNRPRVLTQTEEDAVEWSFVLSGGQDTNPRQTRTERPREVWEMDGEISIRGTCHKTVADFACRMVKALPCNAADGIPGLQRCWKKGGPTFTRELVPTGDSSAAMQDIVAVYATIDVHAVFQETQSANPEPQE